jgi:serine/threonine-protein kinase PknK
MPYHAKDSLDVMIRRHGPFGWCETLSIGVKLAGALEAAHQAARCTVT